MTNENGGPTAKISYRALPHKGQLAILCLARLADPLAQTSIQSYMFYQLRFFDPSASQASISAQAGFLIGAKTAAQVCTGMLWGKVADSEFGGRKLVLAIGLLSSSIAYIAYGLSRSLAAAVFWQVAAGALNSNIAIIRCVVAELNPEKRLRARALLLLPLCANAGNLVGPLVGGFLSSNANSDYSAKYPFLGPNIFASVTYALAAAGVIFRLKETHQSLHNPHESRFRVLLDRLSRIFKRIWPAERHAYTQVASDESTTPLNSPGETPAATEPAKPKNEKLPFRRIWTFNVLCTMLSHFIISGHLGTFTSLWTIFLSTPVGNDAVRKPPFKFDGGLGMLPRDVGLAMSFLGAVGVLLQLVIYPLLQDRFGTVRIWRSALLVFPVVYILAPYPSLIASAPSLSSASATALTWITVGAVIFLFIVGRSGVTPATTLLINDCTPHPSVRGMIHTTGTVTGNLSRSIFPFLILGIFGQGLKIGVVGLGFWCLAGLAVVAYAASLWVVEGSNGKEIVLGSSTPSGNN